MMHTTLERSLDRLGIIDKMPTLKAAATFSTDLINDARTFLTKALPKDLPLDVVFLGSVARHEASKESDLDYLILAYGLPPRPKDTRLVLLEVDRLREKLLLDNPGLTGMFARVVASSELTERIGLEQDTNLTHSRRILILEESVSVFQPHRHEELLRKIIQRYLADYDPPKSGVPRFLLNDVLRYWRTLAVDYQAKRWEGLEQQWGLRFLKLIISRKLAFAGTLVSILLTEQATEDYFFQQFSLPSLARLAQLSDKVENDYQGDLRECFLIAEKFASALEDKEFRKEAEEVKSRGDIRPDSRFDQLRLKGDELQRHLQRLFFHSELLRDKSIKYLSF